MSKKAWIVLENDYRFDDYYYGPSGVPVPDRIFDTREEAEICLNLKNIETARYHSWTFWERLEPVAETNPEILQTAYVEIAADNDPPNYREAEEEFIEKLSDEQITQLLDALDVSFHVIEQIEVPEARADESVSDWHLVVKLQGDPEYLEQAEVVGAYPFREVAERVVEAWYAESRLLKLGDFATYLPDEMNDYYLRSFRNLLGDPKFKYKGSPRDLPLKDFTREQLVNLIRFADGEYLEVRKQ